MNELNNEQKMINVLKKTIFICLIATLAVFATTSALKAQTEAQSLDAFVSSHGGGENAGDGTTFTSNGKKYKIQGNGEGRVVEYADGDMKGCDVLPVKIYNMTNCFVCPLVAVVLNTVDAVTSKAFSSFAGGFQKVMTILFALWLALLALRQVFAFTKQDAPKFFNALIKQSFKFLIAFLLLSNASFLYGKFILPVLSSGMTLGEGIQVNLGEDTKNKKPSVLPEDYAFSGGYFTSRNGGVSFYDRIESGLTNIQSNLARTQAVGSVLICAGLSYMSFFGEDKIQHGLNAAITGLIIAALSLGLSIVFGFYMLDAFIQLTVVGAMMPLMIAGWPFKITSSYASTGLKTILNSFFVLFFLGFVVSVCVQLISNSFTVANLVQSNSAGYEQSRDHAVGGLSYIEQLINEQNVDELMEYADIGGLGLLLLVFASFFGFKFVGEATNLASSLSGGMVSGVSTSAATMGASFAKGVVTKAASPLTENVSDFYHNQGGVIGMTTGAAGAIFGGVAKHAEKHGKDLQDKIAEGRAAGKKMYVARARAGFTSFVTGTNKFAAKTFKGTQNLSKDFHNVYQEQKKKK